MDSFEKNIFINCPFDEEYKKDFLRPLLFTIKTCGFNPRIASERFDSSENRLLKIKGLIEESKYSIHDLSRVISTKGNEYYRLNMPFEIGLDLGCKYYNQDTKYSNKQTLIIEREPFAYQKALSDLAGFDVRCYGKEKGEENEQLELIGIVRNWLSDFCENQLLSGSYMWTDYNLFLTDMYSKLNAKKFTDREINALPLKELLSYIDNWETE